MTTTVNIENATVQTTFDSNMKMISARLETSERVVKIQMGLVSKKWSMMLDSKTQLTNMEHNKNLRTYVGKSYDEAISYWNKKLLQLTK